MQNSILPTSFIKKDSINTNFLGKKLDLRETYKGIAATKDGESYLLNNKPINESKKTNSTLSLWA